MTQAKVRFANFEEYLSYSETTAMEGQYELIDGVLVELPPESRLNSTIAIRILLALMTAGIAVELIHPGKCEVQVPVLQPGDAANRFPDLVVLQTAHLELTRRRLTITLDMPPPRLIVEIVSPGKSNRDRDYIYKKAQYAAIGVPEYWLVNPATQTVTVLSLEGQTYREVGVFEAQAEIVSIEFADLNPTVKQLFESDG